MCIHSKLSFFQIYFSKYLFFVFSWIIRTTLCSRNSTCVRLLEQEEQLAIRQRWATIVYDDDFDANTRTTYYGTLLFAYSNHSLESQQICLTTVLYV